jgi:hypothetical protein
MFWSQAPVAHACNPGYSGDRDQEDCDLKPVWANSSWRPYIKKKTSRKRVGGVPQGVGPEFKPQYHKKKKKKAMFWSQSNNTAQALPILSVFSKEIVIIIILNIYSENTVVCYCFAFIFSMHYHLFIIDNFNSHTHVYIFGQRWGLN